MATSAAILPATRPPPVTFGWLLAVYFAITVFLGKREEIIFHRVSSNRSTFGRWW